MISALTARLETLSLLNLVAGAADFAVAAETSPPATPAAYLLPLQEAVSGNALSCGGVAQTVTASFGIALAVSNVSDATGAAALADLTALRREVGPGLLGWTPDGEVYAPLEYGGGALLGFKNGVLWWQDVYVTQFIIKT